MPHLPQKPLLIMLILTSTLSLRAQTSPAQPVGDSLQLLLTYFYEHAANAPLKQDVSELLASYKKDAVDDSLSVKLLKAEEGLLKDTRLDQKKVFSYAVMLEQVMQRLHPNREHPGYAGSLFNLARMYDRIGQYGKALQLCEEVLAIRKKIIGEDNAEYASTLNFSASIYRKNEMYDKGLALCLQGLAIRKKLNGEENHDYVSSLSTLGNLYLTMGQFKNALPVYEQELAIIKKISGTENADYTGCVSNLVILHSAMGEYEKSLPLNLEVLPIMKKLFGEESYPYANSLHTLSNIYKRTGEYEKALPLAWQALVLKKKAVGDAHPDIVRALGHLSGLYADIGQYHRAMPFAQEAEAVARKTYGQNHSEYAATLNQLAILYESVGDTSKALPLYRQSLSIVLKGLGRDNPDYSNTLINMGILYYNAGENEKALPLLEEALALKGKIYGAQHFQVVPCMNVMASVYGQMGDYEKALPLTREALAITKKTFGEEHKDYAVGLDNLADVYEHLAQYDQALPLYRQALAIRKKVVGEKHPDYIGSLNSIALHDVLSGKLNEASSILKEANNIELERLSGTYSSLTEQEKIKYLNRELYQFYFLPSLLITHGALQPSMVQQVYKNELVLKGMVLENQKQVLHDIRQSKDSSDLMLYSQWRFNKNYVGRQYLLPVDQRTPGLDSLEDVSNQLEQQLSRRFAAFRNSLQHDNITAKDISRKLSKGQASVEFIRFKLYQKTWTDSIMYAALIVLPGDTSIRFVPLFEEKRLQHLLAPSAFRSSTYGTIRKLYPGTGTTDVQSGAATDSLYLLIWKPLEKYLANVHTVYYAPAGLLHRIPFQALRADATHLLIDKYTLNGLLSTRSLALPAGIMQKPATAGLWGNIVYSAQAEPNGNIASRGASTLQQDTDTTLSSFNFYTSGTKASRGGEWNALPGTRKEMSNIKAVLLQAGIRTTIDSGEVATEAAFKALDGKSPKVLHLATHGFFLPLTKSSFKNNDRSEPDDNAFAVQQNPMFRSGLVLAGGNQTWKGKAVNQEGGEDGILTAYEIAQMDLSNTDLVVLSACETALGDLGGSEGVLGLQRAFKMAGVKQMIVSLWRIPDKETTELMTLFYTNWLHGRPAREALRTAQMKMKEKYPPYYWAAFVLVE